MAQRWFWKKKEKNLKCRDTNKIIEFAVAPNAEKPFTQVSYTLDFTKSDNKINDQIKTTKIFQHCEF